MGPPHVRSGRRLAFTAISFLLPVRLPLPPRFAALTTRRCFTTRTSIQRRLQLSLQQQCPGDNFITTAILAVASSTRSRCPGKVHPLLAGAAAESAALEEERPGGQEELGAATFDAVTSSPGSKLDAKDTGKDATHTAAPSPIDEDSRSGIAPASLDCADRDRWQLRVRQASVAGLVGRVFRARSVPSGLVRDVSRAAQSSTAEATFHNKEMTNLEGGVVSGGLLSRWRGWRRRILRRSDHRATSRAATATAAAAATMTAAAAEAEAMVVAAEAVVEPKVPVTRGEETGPADEGGVKMALAREGGVEGEGEVPEVASSRGTAETSGVVGNARERDVAAVAAATVGAVAIDRPNGDGPGDAMDGSGSVSTKRVKRAMTYDGVDVPPEAWAKVDEIRRRAVAKSCDPEAEEAKSLQLWLASGGKGREGLTDTDILRFVMFRHGDVDAAWKQLKRAAAWRQEHRVDDILSEERWPEFKELQEEIFWIGRDLGGRPTMALRSIAHLPGRIDSDEFQRYFLYLLEQGRQLWGVGSVRQMNIVVDRVGAGVKNQDPRLLSTMLPVFRDAYPDIIYRCYVAPTSWIFRFVWIIAARLVDDRQRKRVLLLLGEWKLRLLEDFDASTLPVHLGGTMDHYPPPQPPVM